MAPSTRRRLSLTALSGSPTMLKEDMTAAFLKIIWLTSMSTGMACRPFRAAVCTETNIVFSAKGVFYKLRNKERSKESAFTFNQILRPPLKTNGHVAEADTPVLVN